MRPPCIPERSLTALRRLALRHARMASEADDLVQDVLLAAVETGRGVGEPGFLAWASGAIRNRARFVARTEGRRRRREQACHMTASAEAQVVLRVPDALIEHLPRSQRLVALLANVGMGRREIAYLLGLSDVALRQRISALRRMVVLHGAGSEAADIVPAELPVGLARRALKASLPRNGERTFAIRDPDGTPIFFSTRAHVSSPGGNKAVQPNGDI